MPDDSAFGELSLEAREVGAAPIVRHFFDRLELDRLLETYVTEKRLGRQSKVPHAKAISVMVMNTLLSRQPLYAVPQWLDGYVLSHFGINESQAKLFNDDRIGRALDRLYDLDPASLMTAVAAKAVREFGLDLRQIHNDTTTVTFSGRYQNQKKRPPRPPLITFGHNKDHRPDLKQLVYSLTICADGAVPVHYKTYDGNTTDDKTHQDTWTDICKLRGGPDFVYVADSKLCTRENMAFIHDQGGRFVTVMPRTRKEDDEFRERLREGDDPVEWLEVWRKPDPDSKVAPDHVYCAYDSPSRTSDGYRLIWYRSSVKMVLDERRRADRMRRARQRIRELQERTGAHAFKSVERAREAAQKVLQQEGAERWIDVDVEQHITQDFKQATPGRPGRNTTYRKVETPVILFHAEDNAEAIQADARCDGVFAMVTCIEADESDARDILTMYKYQPFLEKRNEQLKSVLSVAPVFLKKPQRVAALLFVYFLAVLVFALIERELRLRMKNAGITSLPLYPEQRLCKAPTTAVINQAVEGHRRSRLLDSDENEIRVFHDPLGRTQKDMLRLLGVDLRHYGLTRRR